MLYARTFRYIDASYQYLQDFSSSIKRDDDRRCSDEICLGHIAVLQASQRLPFQSAKRCKVWRRIDCYGDRFDA